MHTAPIMDPRLKPYFDHVWPLFWPWLWWNLIRFARWHMRTGREALIDIDRFGNIRFVYFEDAPAAEDAYIYAPPRLARWERLALAFRPLSLGRGGGVRGQGIAVGTARADTPRPLIPNPFSQGRRGFEAAHPRAPP
ncbi:MAG: hypothetical protein R3B98_01785 [Hyphomonas sp.]